MVIAELKLLGPFEARNESGEALLLPTKKVRALLGFLALQPDRRFARTHLTALLWGEENPVNARHSLRQALSTLRRVCPGLEVGREFVRLRGDSFDVDVSRVERAVASQDLDRLEQAVALSEGELLQGYDVETEMFQSWLYPERERLRSVSRAALEALVRGLAARGRHDRSLTLGRRLVDDDPFEESAHRLYLTLLIEAGQHRAALKHFEDLRAFLHRELGVGPEAETAATVAVLTADPAGAGTAHRTVVDALSQQLAAAVTFPAGVRSKVFVVRGPGELMPGPEYASGTGEQADGFDDETAKAIQQAISAGSGTAPSTLSLAGGAKSVLVPLRSATGKLEGVLALLIQVNDEPQH